MRPICGAEDVADVAGTNGRVRRVLDAQKKVLTVFGPWAVVAREKGAGDAADELVHRRGRRGV